MRFLPTKEYLGYLHIFALMKHYSAWSPASPGSTPNENAELEERFGALMGKGTDAGSLGFVNDTGGSGGAQIVFGDRHEFWPEYNVQRCSWRKLSMPDQNTSIERIITQDDQCVIWW